jgi:hypothetical protein
MLFICRDMLSLKQILDKISVKLLAGDYPAFLIKIKTIFLNYPLYIDN